MQPHWSPDGTKIVFSSNWQDEERNGPNYDIYILELDSNFTGVYDPNSAAFNERITRLTTDGSKDMFPTWSPDGTKIAFSAGGVLTVMNADGSNVTSLDASVYTPGCCGAHGNLQLGGGIAWSPDGTKIAYPSAENGKGLYVINSDATGKMQLTNKDGSNSYGGYQPDWSPDGTKIVYVWGQNQSMYIMDADGSNQTRLTGTGDMNGNGTFTWPEWKP